MRLLFGVCGFSWTSLIFPDHLSPAEGFPLRVGRLKTGIPVIRATVMPEGRPDF
jgi:hypothetical protein